MKCSIDGKLVKCKVIEDMGFQRGKRVKAIEHNGIEYIVIRDGQIWRTVNASEKLLPPGNYVGQ